MVVGLRQGELREGGGQGAVPAQSWAFLNPGWVEQAGLPVRAR